jgi:hypothetical protein
MGKEDNTYLAVPHPPPPPQPSLSNIRKAHRVGRVLSFFSSRRNWDSPNHLSAGKYAPPPPPPKQQ